MELLSRNTLQTLVSSPQKSDFATSPDPCISLYVPKEVLEEAAPDAQRSWHSLVKRVESFMAQKYPGRQTTIRDFYDKIKEFVRQRKNLGGVAVFESRLVSGFVPLGNRVQQLAIVSDSFHLKPLLHEIQGQNRYYILTLENHRVQLWEGGSSSVEKKAIYQMPQNQKISDRSSRTESSDEGAEASDQGRQRKGFLRYEARMMMRFYKEVGKRLKKQVDHFQDPVYIVGEPAHRALFMSANRAKNLVTHSRLDISPKKLQAESLYEMVWSHASHDIDRKVRRFARDYRLYQHSGRSVEDLPTIAEAAFAGKLEALLVTRDLHLWGEVDPKTGTIKRACKSQGELSEDILDDLAEAVIAHGGRVFLLDPKDMPESLTVWGVLKRGVAKRGAT